jgi:hypothetical protein
MTLREALANKGYTPESIDETISDMIADINVGFDPEEVLHNEGLEPDYVIDLLNEML